MSDSVGVILNPKLLPESIMTLEARLNRHVVGQSPAMTQIVKAWVPTTVKIHRAGRPLGVFMFLGPTGVGKTETVRTLAESLLGSRDAITRIDCAEYASEHDVAKILGAPPGYVGYGVPSPLAQANIDKHQTKKTKINIVMFDEIEKAHPRLFDAIMTVLGDGRMLMGDNTSVNFEETFIFMTTNLASKDIAAIAENGGIGFTRSARALALVDEQIDIKVKEQMKKVFRAEFINRIDSTVVFKPLDRDSFLKILALQAEELQYRIWKSPWRDLKPPFKKDEMPPRFRATFKLTDAAKVFMLKEGTSAVYGAREMNRAVDKFLQFPWAALMATQQIVDEDKIIIDHIEGEDELQFRKLNGEKETYAETF